MDKGEDLLMPSLVDRLSNDIDPFTLFAMFTREIRPDRKIRIMKEFKSEFKMEADVPFQNPIVPTANNRSVGFFSGYDGIKGDINILWDVLEFVEGLDPFDESTDQEQLIRLIDASLNIGGVAMSKVTMGLYWTNPYNFLHIKTINGVAKLTSGEQLKDRGTANDYLRCLKRTREIVQCAFPNLNIPVWVLDERQDAPKVWVVCADQARLAGDFISKGYIVGWEPHKVDMSSITTRKEIVDIYDGLIPQLEVFLLKMQPGDYVITPSGKKDFFYCIVGKRGLFFSSNDQETRREAHWIGGPLRKDTASSIPWNNQRPVFEVVRTDQRNEFFNLIGRNDLIENA